MATNIPLKHHYVPQAYLRRFSDDDKHVFILRKDDGKLLGANISDVCAERDFYSRFGINQKRDVGIEKAYAMLEDAVPNKIFELIPKELIYPYQSGGAILNPMQKSLLAEAIHLQIARGKSTRIYGQSVAESLYDDLLEKARNKFPDNQNTEEQFEYLSQNKQTVLRNSIAEGSIMPFTNKSEHSLLRDNLQNRNCVIFINQTGIDLITSDDPILIGNEAGEVDKVFNYPLGNPESLVFYPLDAKHLAMLCTQERCGGSYDYGMTAILSPKDAVLIKNLNVAQYRHCVNYIISNDKSILNKTRMLAKHF